MAAVLARRPVGVPVEAVPEGEIGVQPGPVGAQVAVRQVERVLTVVEVADLQVAVDRVELLRGQHHVLDLGAPDALDPHVEHAAGERLGDHGQQLRAAEKRGVELYDEAEDVLAVEEDRRRVGERQLPRGDGLQRCGGVHDERVPAPAGEDPDTVPLAAGRVVDPEGDGLAGRGRTHALLLEAPRPVRVHVR